MTRPATITALSFAATLLALAAPTPLPAAQASSKSGITMPVTSADSVIQLAGTFDLGRSVATDTGVAAVGTLTGPLVDTLGNPTTVVRPLAIPVAVAAATRDIPDLEFGPLILAILS